MGLSTGVRPPHLAKAVGQDHRPALRMTPQRQAILDAVRSSHDHPRAADIFERVRAVLPGIAFATVYNALHALADHGIILQLSFGDHASRFDGRIDRHDHALCTRCGELVDAVAPPTPDIVRQAADEIGFAIHAYHTQLLGVCAACQAREEAPPLSTAHHRGEKHGEGRAGLPSGWR